MIRQHEPCESCGDETAIGSPLYGERREATDKSGRQTFLCGPCAERLAAARRRGEPLSDEDRRKLESGAAVFGAFAPGGH